MRGEWGELGGVGLEGKGLPSLGGQAGSGWHRRPCGGQGLGKGWESWRGRQGWVRAGRG